MTRILMSILFILSVTVVQAQVYKCTAADGSITFSDRACAGDAEVVKDLDSGSSGVGSSMGGPPSSLTLGDGSILLFKKIIAIQVKTETGYKTGKTGLHIFYEGTDHLVAFENLVSFYVTTWDRKSCGNWSHICEPRVRIQTNEREINTRYQALRNIKLLIDDELDGVEKEMTIFFGVENRPHIRIIRF